REVQNEQQQVYTLARIENQIVDDLRDRLNELKSGNNDGMLVEAHGYDGKYLMIHGACVSVGCYAMTDSGIDEIFQFVTAALVFG
ncbi:hypothetical protein MJI46_32940, partial [Salmonella enterica subsp. enterica serovar Cerro]|nr:hypothetical protein [Salmonella enterica subsp. enterica serovar Cerro]